MYDKVITVEQRAAGVNMIAAWRNLQNYYEAVGDTHAADRFSAYCTAGVIMLGDLLGESYASVERAVLACSMSSEPDYRPCAARR